MTFFTSSVRSFTRPEFRAALRDMSLRELVAFCNVACLAPVLHGDGGEQADRAFPVFAAEINRKSGTRLLVGERRNYVGKQLNLA